MQTPQITLDAPAPVPPHERRWNLVAERVRQNRRVPGHGAHLGAHEPAYVRRAVLIGEKADVLVGREIDDDAQPVLRGEIEQRVRRRVVHADRVDPVRRHRGEVAFDQLKIVVLVAVLVGSKRPVRHAADVELVLPHPDELPSSRRTHAGVNSR